MTLTRRARGAWPVVGAVLALATATIAALQQPPQTPAAAQAAGAIAGRILDEDGSPLAAARVEVLVARIENGRRTVVPVGSAETDDRGEFRISGLSAGQYYVSASDTASHDVAGEPGADRFAPTFYPGVTLPHDARTVSVADAGVAPHIEIRFKRVRSSRIDGRIASFDRRQLLSGAVILAPLDNPGVQVVTSRDVRIDPEGTFSFVHVPPGRYRIRARGATKTNGPLLFATFGLIVEGRDIDNVQLILRPGGTLEGGMTTDTGAAARLPVLSMLRVRAPFADGGDFGDVLGGSVRADGRFELGGLMPGEHQVIVEGLPAPWVVQSVLLRGRDIADVGFEVGEGQQLRGARIVITDRTSELTGRVRDAGRPVPDAAVLVYSVTPQFWVHTHRRMRMTRTDDDGEFSLGGLPPGDYLAIASGAIDEEDLGRRQLLESIRTISLPFSIPTPDARVTLELPYRATLPGAPLPTR